MVSFSGSSFMAVLSPEKILPSGTYIHRVSESIVPSTAPVTNPSSFPLADSGISESHPGIACNSAQCLWVWQDARDGNYDIFGITLNRDGTALAPSPFPITRDAANQRNPAVAFNGTDFIVAWQDERGGTTSPDIYIARVDTSGAVRDPNGIKVSNSPTASSKINPQVAASGVGQSLILWEDSRDASGAHIYGARVDPNGAVLDPGNFGLLTGLTGDQHLPQLAYNGSEYLAAWKQTIASPNKYGIDAVRISTSGKVLDTSGLAIALSANVLSAPSVGSHGSNFLVAWASDLGSGQSGMVGTEVRFDGTVSGAPELFSSSADSINHSCLSFDGVNYLLTWETTRRDPRALGLPSLFAAILNPSGTLQTGSANILSSQSEAIAAALAPLTPGHFLITYQAFKGAPFGSSRVLAQSLILEGLGQACTDPNQCGSGFCTDGVCCDSACGYGSSQDCQACAVSAGANANGTCGVAEKIQKD